MAAPKSASYRGWFFDRENSQLDAYLGFGGASDPVSIGSLNASSIEWA